MKIFKKKLTKTDVEKRLAMRTKSLIHFPTFAAGQHAQILKVEDFQDKQEWRFRLTIRRRGKYSKPVLSRGWVKFVQTKMLQIGDQVEFLVEKDEATGLRKYVIKVHRMPCKPVKLFGVVIGYTKSPTNTE